MIRDKVFKSLLHSYSGFEMVYNGQTVEAGYKPDYVLSNGNEYIILESESSSSRKMFVGGMIKAAHFLQGERHGKLIFVVVPKANTKAKSIALHLKRYLDWLEGKTNLSEVYVIEAKQYYSNQTVLAIDCDEFQNCAFKV